MMGRDHENGSFTYYCMGNNVQRACCSMDALRAVFLSPIQPYARDRRTSKEYKCMVVLRGKLIEGGKASPILLLTCRYTDQLGNYTSN